MGQPPLGREGGEIDTDISLQRRVLLGRPAECGVVILDHTGTIKLWNEGARSLYGYNEQEVVGQPLPAVLPSPASGDNGDYRAILRTVETNGSAVEWNTRRSRKDGSSFPVAVATSSLLAADGSVQGFCEITIPIMDGDRDVHSTTEKLYGALMSGLSAHIAILDRTGVIVAVNDAWTHFARENGAESLDAVGVGVNYLDVCRRSAPKCAPAAECLRGLQATLSGSNGEFSLEYSCHSPRMQRWFRMCATPWVSEGGAVVAHNDITERVRAEIRLQQSEQHYRAMIENEVDIVTILDKNANIMFESPALKQILGYSPEELIGRSVFDYIHPADIANVKKAFKDVLSSNEPSPPLEFRFRHAESGYRVVESVARNLLANPGVRGIIVNSRDITQRRAAETTLRKRESALKLSHEKLRALSARLLEAEDLERRRISRELHDDLNQELAALAVDILHLQAEMKQTESAGLSAEVGRLQQRIVSLSDTVRRLAYRLHPSILDHLGLAAALRSYCAELSRRDGIEIDFVHRNVQGVISPEVASCVYRVAQEALRNVARHSGAKCASVRLWGSRRFVSLVVADPGMGFYPDRVGAGQSLGLTSMEERSRLLNGRFRVSSAPGAGTTVRLRVPREVLAK